MDQLADFLKGLTSSPYLFLGSGISRRYLNAPSWKELLEHFAKIAKPELDLPFQYYEGKAKRILATENKGSKFLYPIIADFISEDFHEVWHTDSAFADSRSEILKENLSFNSPLKIEISKLLTEIAKTSGSVYKEEIEALFNCSKKSVTGVITTNYDPFIESLFNKESQRYDVLICQDDMMFSYQTGLQTIYKLHGSCGEPNSLVLTSKDYDAFRERQTFLSAKLLTLLVEHPVIFIGYNLGDPNIDDIFFRLLESLDSSRFESLARNMLFVSWDSALSSPKLSNLIRDIKGRSLNITHVTTGSFLPIYEGLLTHVQTKYSPRLIHELQQDLHFMIQNNSPTGRIVKIIDGNESFEGIDVVIGVASVYRKAFESYSADEIYADVLFDRLPQNIQTAMPLIEKTLPHLMKFTGYHLPVYKYIRSFSGSIPPELTQYIGSYKEFKNFFSNSIVKKGGKFGTMNLIDFLKMHSVNNIIDIRKLYRLKEEYLTSSMLETYLKPIVDKFCDKKLNSLPSSPYPFSSSDVKRYIRLYDWLKYKNERSTHTL